MTGITFAISYALLNAVMVILEDRKLITSQQYYAYVAISSTVAGVVCAYLGWTIGTHIQAAVAAWSAWSWWHGGGGDDMKRRLKKWARRFQGVRRTAPAGA
jgi:hypothetical protein